MRSYIWDMCCSAIFLSELCSLGDLPCQNKCTSHLLNTASILLHPCLLACSWALGCLELFTFINECCSEHYWPCLCTHWVHVFVEQVLEEVLWGPRICVDNFDQYWLILSMSPPKRLHQVGTHQGEESAGFFTALSRYCIIKFSKRHHYDGWKIIAIALLL